MSPRINFKPIVWVLAGPLVAFLAEGVRADDSWPQFRGPGASGVAEGHHTPVGWDAATGNNIRWKTPIPGLSHASPIVWGDRVFITTAVATGKEPELKIGLYGAGDSADDMVEHAFKVYALDRNTGKIVWEQTAHTGVPKVKRHTKATHCNSTPATDGRHVVALFGSEGLYCYDFSGKLLWKKDLGVLDVGPYNALELQWGFASSPIIHEGKVIVQADVKKDPFLAAFEVESGKELWRFARDDVPGWGTPTAYGKGPDARVLVNGCKHMGGYDLATGKETWRMSGGGGIPVPAPVVSGDLIFLTSNHQPINPTDPPQPIFAIKTSATGDISTPPGGGLNASVAWLLTQRGSYMQTPLAYQGILYVGKDNGIITAYDAATGEQKWRERIAEGSSAFTASPVAADGKVYYTSESGDVMVLKSGPTFEKLGIGKLGESCLSTPAISQGALFFHTRGHVIAVAESGTR